MHHNIWALKRHTDIKYLLLRLTEVLGDKSFLVHAPEEGHQQSIDLVSPENLSVRAYIYTFCQEPGFFGLVIDYPILTDNNLESTETSHENISFDTLIELLAAHFDVVDY